MADAGRVVDAWKLDEQFVAATAIRLDRRFGESECIDAAFENLTGLIKMEEKVPTMMPITNARENPRNTDPPKKSRDKAVSRVRPEVRIVRLRV